MTTDTPMPPTYRNALETGERLGSRYSLSIPRTALTGATGTRVGSAPGSSLEFREFRDYQPGDDLRRIDWGAYARSDRLIVRIYHEEVAPHAEILIDTSRSMELAGSAKASTTVTLASLLAVAAANTGCTYRTWVGGDGFQPVPDGSGPPSAWRQLSFDNDGSLLDAYRSAPPRLRGRSVRIVLSDLLWLGDPLALLQPLAHDAAGLVIVQILAQSDMAPVQRGNATLVDCETGEEHKIFIDAATERRYAAAYTTHVRAWHEACRRVGAQLLTVNADALSVHWDLSEFVAAKIVEVV